MKLTSILIILLFAFTLAACGGGGSSGPAAMDPDGTNDGTGDDGMAMTCDPGYSLNADGDDCVKDGPTPEEQAAMDETEAKKVAGYIDRDSKRVEGQVPVTVMSNSEGSDVPTGLDVRDEMPVFDGTTADKPMGDFVKSTDAVASLGMRWKGGKYTRTKEDGDTTVVDTIVKYADKAANTDSNFRDYFDVARKGTTEAASSGVLTLAEDQAGNHELFSIDFGIDGRNQDNPITHARGENSTDFKGMFTGVPGTFSCTGECEVSSDKDGNLSGLAGTWMFKPDGLTDEDGVALADDDLTAALGKIRVPGVLPDADYMIFGYWLQETTDGDGMVTRAFSAFMDGNQPYGDTDTVVGTATYTGPATGMYMKKSLTSEGEPTRPFSSGQFTADAELNANFGGNDIGTNHQFSVTGTISNFMDGSEVINDQWVVNLNREMIDADNDANTPDVPEKNIGTTGGMFSGVTDGGKLGSGEGGFSGMFHGPDTDDAQPSSASGIFDGHFTNGHVRGAFGVHKQAK